MVLVNGVLLKPYPREVMGGRTVYSVKSAPHAGSWLTRENFRAIMRAARTLARAHGAPRPDADRVLDAILDGDKCRLWLN